MSNHSHVLLSVARDVTLRIRDIALEVGITERAVRHIISDLEEAVTSNVHVLVAAIRIEQHKTIEDLISAIYG